jgi:alanine racemase
MEKTSLAASWLEIKASALKNNVQTFRNLANLKDETTHVGVVLKGNAYGHGLAQVYSVIHDSVDCVYLIDPVDAYLLRRLEKEGAYPEKRLLVIGAVREEEVLECARQNIEVVLSDLNWKSYEGSLKKNGLKVRVHLHLDTGLSREGFFLHELEPLCNWLNQNKDIIQVVGVMSHFANTEDVTDQSYAEFQLSNFSKGIAKIESLVQFEDPLEKHIAASAASMVLANSHFNYMRIGIALYGLWPSSETKLSAKSIYPKLPVLQPALTWKCRSQAVKTIPAGSYVGYGCTYRCARDTRIAVLPVGYFDGYPRAVSGKAYVLVDGKRCPVLGRVMMNNILIDISQLEHNPTAVEAILIGQDGDETLSVETVANWAQTIHYEIIARLSQALKRVIV